MYGVLLGIMVVLVALAIVAGQRQNKTRSVILDWETGGLRQKIWRDFARRHGFRYFPEDVHDIPNRYQFDLFERGYSRRAYNLVEGHVGKLPLALFDYSYEMGSAEDSESHRLSAVLSKLPIECPYLMIRPATMLDRFPVLFASERIEFETEQFNRAFQVHGQDKKFAYDICHPKMMEFLLETRIWTLEFRGPYLWFYDPYKEFTAADVERSLALAAEFVSRIPNHLQNEA
jgi:hypothetical protein